jgi:ribonuclease HI
MMTLPSKLRLYFDGSCEPKNPGGIAGYGWRIVDMDGNEVKTDSAEVCRGQGATNNIAEWAGVTNGLRFLKSQGWSGQLEICGDSQLVIYQLTGRYKCRKDTLIPYHDECKNLLVAWDWSATWIPREENADCDEMSKRAYRESR